MSNVSKDTGRLGSRPQIQKKKEQIRHLLRRQVESMEKRFFQGLQRDPRYPRTDMGEHPISGCHHGRHLGVAVGFRGPVMQVIDQSLRTGF